MFKRLAALFAALLLATPAFAMTAASIPTKFSIPWGNSAGGSYIRAIPTSSQIGVQNGAASLTDGFPPLTFVPVGSGGVPPFGMDFNGILKQITQWSRWQGAGGLPVYDGTFSGAIGGYPQGAVLAGASPGVVWLNLVDNNTTNPDSAGANWKQLLLADGGTMTNGNISTSVIKLQQSGVPAPTAEGQIEWGTTNAQLAIGHSGGTLYLSAGPAPGALYGLTISNDVGSPTNTIDFATGQASDSTNSLYETLGSPLAKQLNNAWSAGSNAGGLFSGSMTNGTYHCFVIENPTTGAVDAGFSTSVTASDHPSGFTLYRRVGSILVSGGAIVAFHQYGDVFRLASRAEDVNVNAPGTSAVTANLSVPTGILVNALTDAGLSDNNSNSAKYLVISALVDTDVAASLSNFTTGTTGNSSGNPTFGAAGEQQTLTNTSGQIRWRSSYAFSNLTIIIFTVGWIDTRGRT